MKKFKKRWMKGYAVELQQLEDGYFAYIVEFGHSACSATGLTLCEVFLTLESVLNHLLKVMEENGDPIPEPLGDPFKEPRSSYGSVSEQQRGEKSMFFNPFPWY